MNIKTLAIIAGSSLILTLSLVIFSAFYRTKNEDQTASPTPTISVLPTIDVNQPPPAGQAKITGKICPPPIKDGLNIIAEQIPNRQKFTKFIPGPVQEPVNYSLEVAPGNYEVFTELINRDKVGLYSEYIACGANPTNCPNHNLIQITARADQTTSNIDICDYQWTK